MVRDVWEHFVSNAQGRSPSKLISPTWRQIYCNAIFCKNKGQLMPLTLGVGGLYKVLKTSLRGDRMIFLNSKNKSDQLFFIMLAQPNGWHTSVCLVDNMQQTTGTKTQKKQSNQTASTAWLGNAEYCQSSNFGSPWNRSSGNLLQINAEGCILLE